MAKLTAKQLKALPDSMFGLPKTRQYPMPDKAHVIKAIQFFKFCPDKDKPELARNINRRAKELKMQIKVQPSSAFYKYADKSILKEAMLVQEFHIGQLSPIVTLQPTVLQKNFDNGIHDNLEGPLERLRKIWGSKKPLESKVENTATTVEKAMLEGYHFTALDIQVLEGIDFLNYMQTPHSGNAYQLSLADRTTDRNNEFLEVLKDHIRLHDLNSIVHILRNLGYDTRYACALAIIDYTTDLTADEKAFIKSKVIGNPGLHQNVPTAFNDTPEEIGPTDSVDKVEYIRNVTDDEIYVINQFINLITEPRKLFVVLNNLAKTKFRNEDIGIYNGYFGEWLDDEGQPTGIKLQMDISEFMAHFQGSKIGYYRKPVGRGFFDFLVFNSARIYAVEYVKTATKRYLYLLCIHDKDNVEYNDNIMAYVMGSDLKFNIISRVITITPHKPSLEASTFKDVYNGIQISKNGNVSFMLDELEPWGDKYSLCKQMMERNLKDCEYEHYKNNLCALFTLINVIYNRFNPTLADDSMEAKQALGVMDKSMTLFKDGIQNITKIQPEFNFLDYYISVHYNEKIEVFRALDDKELRSEAMIAYGWIMK